MNLGVFSVCSGMAYRTSSVDARWRARAASIRKPLHPEQAGAAVTARRRSGAQRSGSLRLPAAGCASSGAGFGGLTWLCSKRTPMTPQSGPPPRNEERRGSEDTWGSHP